MSALTDKFAELTERLSLKFGEGLLAEFLVPTYRSTYNWAERQWAGMTDNPVLLSVVCPPLVALTQGSLAGDSTQTQQATLFITARMINPEDGSPFRPDPGVYVRISGTDWQVVDVADYNAGTGSSALKLTVQR